MSTLISDSCSECSTTCIYICKFFESFYAVDLPKPLNSVLLPRGSNLIFPDAVLSPPIKSLIGLSFKFSYECSVIWVLLWEAAILTVFYENSIVSLSSFFIFYA